MFLWKYSQYYREKVGASILKYLNTKRFLDICSHMIWQILFTNSCLQHFSKIVTSCVYKVFNITKVHTILSDIFATFFNKKSSSQDKLFLQNILKGFHNIRFNLFWQYFIKINCLCIKYTKLFSLVVLNNSSHSIYN